MIYLLSLVSSLVLASQGQLAWERSPSQVIPFFPINFWILSYFLMMWVYIGNERTDYCYDFAKSHLVFTTDLRVSGSKGLAINEGSNGNDYSNGLIEVFLRHLRLLDDLKNGVYFMIRMVQYALPSLSP
jgi:hypothetical protein